MERKIVQQNVKIMNLSAKKEHIFEETCVYEAVGSLSVMPSLHFSLMFSEGEVKSLYFLQVW